MATSKAGCPIVAIDEMPDHLGGDLEGRMSHRRHRIQLGTTDDGETFTVPAHGTRLLIAGASGSGKSTIATAILEQLFQDRYQCLLVDPEGDYAKLERAIVLGDASGPATAEELLDVLRKPGQSVVALLLGLDVTDRPAFFQTVAGRLAAFFADTGRPHWLVLDEAHHLLTMDVNALHALPQQLDSTMLITVHPELLPRDVLSEVSCVVAVGPTARDVLQRLASSLDRHPSLPRHPGEPGGGEALVWSPDGAATPIKLRAAVPRGERQRHRRKYATGTLGPDKSFYFRGPDGRLRLRAQNLGLFLQMADGVDDDTWDYHLRRGDYSRWIRESIKDAELADEVAAIESGQVQSAENSRAAVAEAIGRRYTEAG